MLNNKKEYEYENEKLKIIINNYNNAENNIKLLHKLNKEKSSNVENNQKNN